MKDQIKTEIKPTERIEYERAARESEVRTQKDGKQERERRGIK